MRSGDRLAIGSTHSGNSTMKLRNYLDKPAFCRPIDGQNGSGK